MAGGEGICYSFYMSVDALQLKKGLVQAGIKDDQAEKMAEAIRDSLKDGDLTTKADLERAKLQIVGYTVTIQTIIMALFQFFGS